MKAIIDIDSYLYRASMMCEELVTKDGVVYTTQYNTNKAMQYLTDIADSIMKATKTSEYVFVTSNNKTNFRKIINPLYKSNRKKQAIPIMLSVVKDLIFKKFPVGFIPHLEADDTCRVIYETDGGIVVSIDKDLRTFPCKIYNPDKDKMEVVSDKQADSNFKRQLIMGDTCDGYNGLKGYGVKTTDKLLEKGISIQDIIDLYLEEGYTIDDFKSVYNSARILGKDDLVNNGVKLYGGEILEFTD